MKSVVVLGSVNVDIFFKCTRMPEMGETIFGERFYWYPGGKGANQAVGIARLGIPVYLIGRVGEDPFREGIIGRLRKERVNTEFMIRDEKNPSGMALVLVDKNGENSIIVIRGANSSLSQDDVDRAKSVIQKASILVTQLEIPVETVAHALRLARESGVQTILNPSPGSALSSEILSNVEIIVPNRNEAEKLAGAEITSLKKAKEICKMLIEKGVKAVVLTLGEKGALLMNKGKACYVDAIPVRPVDTSGAGDSFMASFIAGLVRNKDLEESVRLANYAASFSVTRLGAQASLPQQEELQGFNKENTE